MIKLTRLDGEVFILNAELIRYIEQRPDTFITLTTGDRLVVREKMDEVMDRAVAYHQAKHLIPSPPIRPRSPLSQVSRFRNNRMDLGTILGLLLASVALIYSIVAGGGAFQSFIDLPALACVFGGAMAAVLICFPLRNVLGFPRVLLKSLFNKVPDTNKNLELLVSLATTARRDGLLALERRLEEIDDSFIVLGIQLAVDGARPEVIEELLRAEMDAIALRHKDGKGVIDMIGKYCPAFGMIGTLLGLIMLGQMSDPTAIGAGMAVALLTTLYGTLAANAIFLPISDKLAFFNRAEQRQMELVIKGIMAIQSGEHPRVVEQRLVLFLPPTARAAN